MKLMYLGISYLIKDCPNRESYVIVYVLYYRKDKIIK